MPKPILVGESNPYGADPYYALYPSPDRSAGHRLCTMILGMQRKTYLDFFDRVNLCAGKWSIKEAREKAAEISAFRKAHGGVIIMCGSKVASGFGIPFEPFTRRGDSVAILPHPSGLCRLWLEKDAIAKARAIVLEVIPELAEFIDDTLLANPQMASRTLRPEVPRAGAGSVELGDGSV